jgi:hypothetical protein
MGKETKNGTSGEKNTTKQTVERMEVASEKEFGR